MADPRVLFCPICRKYWTWDGRPFRFDDKTVIPEPTKLDRCTCRTCYREVHAEHGPKTFNLVNDKELGDDDPGQQNAIRAMEDG